MPSFLRITNRLSELKKVADHLTALGAEWSLSTRSVFEINLILDELVTNIIEHGNAAEQQLIEITLVRDTGQITITVSDSGPAFDPTSCPSPDINRPLAQRRCGGLGIHLVRRFSDNFHYSRSAGKNIFTLTKTLAKEGSQAV